MPWPLGRPGLVGLVDAPLGPRGACRRPLAEPAGRAASEESWLRHDRWQSTSRRVRANGTASRRGFSLHPFTASLSNWPTVGLRHLPFEPRVTLHGAIRSSQLRAMRDAWLRPPASPRSSRRHPQHVRCGDAGPPRPTAPLTRRMGTGTAGPAARRCTCTLRPDPDSRRRAADGAVDQPASGRPARPADAEAGPPARPRSGLASTRDGRGGAAVPRAAATAATDERSG